MSIDSHECWFMSIDSQYEYSQRRRKASRRDDERYKETQNSKIRRKGRIKCGFALWLSDHNKLRNVRQQERILRKFRMKKTRKRAAQHYQQAKFALSKLWEKNSVMWLFAGDSWMDNLGSFEVSSVFVSTEHLQWSGVINTLHHNINS